MAWRSVGRHVDCLRLVVDQSELVRSSSLKALLAAVRLGRCGDLCGDLCGPGAPGAACVSTGTVMVTRVCSDAWRRGGPPATDGCRRMETGAGSDVCRLMGGVALVGTTGSETWRRMQGGGVSEARHDVRSDARSEAGRRLDVGTGSDACRRIGAAGLVAGLGRGAGSDV